VGTTPEMFSELKYLDQRSYQFAEGENFEAENRFDAVVGSTVAAKTGLTVGGTFQAVHGVVEQGGHVHQQNFNVVGVLKPTGTPNDRALFVNMEGFYQIHCDEHGHDHSDHDHGHDHGHAAEKDDQRQVTAILACIDRSNPGRDRVVAKMINQGPAAQAAVPSFVIAGLFEGIIGNIQLILLLMAVLIVVVAGMGIMVSIYNSMSDRRHEIAVMRALGASRLTVMVVILLESILLSLGGGVLGLLLGHGLIGAMSPVIAEHTGVAVSSLHFQAIELALIPGLIVLASVVGYLPAMAAYRTDVARSLTATQ